MRIIVCSLLVLLCNQVMADEAKPEPKKAEPAKQSPARAAEEMIKGDLKEKHVTLTTMKCPDDVDYTLAQTITCSGTDDEGTKADFKVTIAKSTEKDEKDANKSTTHTQLSWTAQRNILDLEAIGAKMSASLTKAMKKTVTVDCPKKAVFRRDDCAVSCDGKIDGKAHKISVASCPDAAGRMQIKVD